MSIRTIVTVTMPACWASAIINGDYSGLSTEDSAACQAKLESL